MELIVIIVIVGVLGTVSLMNFFQVFEKARIDEAKQDLWQVKVAWGQYRMDNRARPENFTDLNLTDSQFPSACRSEKFFAYSLNSTHAIATRCTVAGKPPQGQRPYVISINLLNSTWGGTPGYY